MPFAMLGLYFPVKEFCREEEHGAAWVIAVFVWVGLFITVRNLLNFRAIILTATEAWQVADARPGLNEMQILVPLLAALILMLFARKWLPRTGLLALFIALLAALVMTKARGYWGDFIFGVGVLFFLLHGRYRGRLLLLIVGSTGVIVFLALAFFGPLVELVVTGTADRFSTLGTALTEDRSLVNRFIETQAIWEHIKQNPILGHGFGTTFTYFDIVFVGTRTKSFVHNGFVALWFKLGIGGLLLMLWAWGGAIWQALKVYWDEGLPRPYRIIALIMAVSLIAIIPSANTSNPFILIDQVYTFTLQLAVACGVYQRFARPSADSPLAAPNPTP